MKFAVAIVALVAQAAAQTAFLASPVLLWTGNISPVDEGNECVLAPANPLLVCTSAEGLVSALPTTTASGTAVATWSYPTDGSVDKSTSGITFSSDGSSFVYGTTDLDNTGSPICHVHHVSVADGTPKWVAGLSGGACSGTPLLSGNDAYVFLTQNGDTSGTFIVLSATDGALVFNQTDPSQLLSPPGIYISPMQGNYAAGIGNTNDIVVFGNKPKITDISVPEQNSVYTFQFPIGFVTGSNATSTLGLVTLLNKTDFQATTAPLITNGGNSMFWGVSRSKVVGWPGVTFDRDPGGASYGFERGDPASLPILADLAIGADTSTPTLYTGKAGPGFAAVTTAGDLALLWNYTTTSAVYTQAKVRSSDAGTDEVVFFFDDAGFAYALDAATGDELWVNATTGSVRGSFALNEAGDTMFFAATNGIVSAWQVAEFGNSTSFAPIASPQSLVPTLNASISPATPSAIGSSAPAAVPTVAGNYTYDVILANSNVTLLPALLNILNLTSALSSAKSTLTVFAPYDSAFTTAFNQSFLDLLSSDPNWIHHLSCLVSAHAIPKFADTTDLWTDGENVTNLSSEPVTLGTSPPSVSGITIDSADNVASNGVVHFIPEPILPSCVANDILSIVANHGNFSTVAELVTLAGLANALVTNLPLTVLAPTNEAFEKVPADILEYLTDPANIAVLQKVLYYHIFRDVIFLDSVDGSGVGVFNVSYESIGVEFSYDNGAFLVGSATIILPSILAKNGIVHGIDMVLIPPDLNLPTPKPTTMSPAAATGAPTRKPTTTAPTAAPTRKASVTPKPTSSGSSAGLSALIAAAVVIGLWM